jgi:hypothetical protein
MKSTGRPAARPVVLGNGFYIEVCNKRSMGPKIKIRCATRQAMEETAKRYAADKDVNILGEYKDGVKVTSQPVNL